VWGNFSGGGFRASPRGNLITSRQPADLPAFMGAIIAGLG